MSHRLIAVVRPLLVATLLLSSLVMLLATDTAAAQNDRGLIDETSYQSPQFGYNVTWAEPWATRDRDVITNPGGFDTIALRGDDGIVRISGRDDTYDPLTFLQDTIAIQLASGGDVINQDTTGAAPMAELLIGNEKMRLEVLSLPDFGAIVLVSLRADQRDYDAAFASAQESIQLNGNPLFASSATPAAVTTETPAAEPTEPVEPVSTPDILGGGVEGNTYTSPNFGFTVSWDPAVWSVPDDAEYSEPDYDTLRIESSTGPLLVTGWNAYNGSASTCLLGEITFYNDPELGISEWQVAVDAEGNELTGETETSAWGVFTNVYTDPNDPNAEPINYVDYIECHGLGDGESVVIFYSYAEREDYNEHIENVLDVVESLELAEGTTTQPATVEVPTETTTPEQPTETPTPEPPVSTPTATTTPETSVTGATPTPIGTTPPVTDLTGGDTVTGQTYAYNFTVPAGWQVSDSSLGGEIEGTTLTNGTSTVSVEARAMTATNLSDCVANIADEDESEPAYADLALARTASGDPFSGEDDFTAFANFTFTGPDGETWSHFVECRWIADGESVLVITQDVPQELFGSERSARRQIQNSIEIGE